MLGRAGMRSRSLTPTVGAAIKFKIAKQPGVPVVAAGAGGRWRHPGREQSWAIPGAGRGAARQIHRSRMGFSLPWDRQASRQPVPALLAAPGGAHRGTLLHART